MKIQLWEVRDKRGITLIELEKLTGISRSTLNNYENEVTSPNLKKLERIAKALDSKMTDLFDSDYK